MERDFDFNNLMWDILTKHHSHHVYVARYGNTDSPQNICLECEDCGEVVLDAGIYTICAREDL